MIGSGFGGLAAAVRLGARGWRVTVLEKLDAPGGRAYVHRQDGLTFDAGPNVITAPFLLEELWALAGKRLADDVDLRPVVPFYRVMFDDGTAFDYSGDAAAMHAGAALALDRVADRGVAPDFGGERLVAGALPCLGNVRGGAEPCRGRAQRAVRWRLRVPPFVVLAVDAALVVIALELVILIVRSKAVPRGTKLAPTIANLLAGASLMAALHAALVPAPWPWIVAALSGAGAMHLLDLVLRRRRSSDHARVSK